jgi:hypothetical protein
MRKDNDTSQLSAMRTPWRAAPLGMFTRDTYEKAQAIDANGDKVRFDDAAVLRTVIDAVNAQDRTTAFIQQVARLTKDGECASCGLSVDLNRDCEDHQLFDMPNDDAVDTLHSLISKARELAQSEEQ